MLIGDPRPNPPGERSVFTWDLAESFVRTLPQVHRFPQAAPRAVDREDLQAFTRSAGDP